MDKKAKEILFKTYWSSAGWVRDENRKIEVADFEYAKEKGLMFDPLTISKSNLISKLDNTIQNIGVSDTFLAKAPFQRANVL